jgi:hypothetical protein
VVVHGNANHAGLVDWFEKLWDRAQDFDAALMNELRRSWRGPPMKPRIVGPPRTSH